VEAAASAEGTEDRGGDGHLRLVRVAEVGGAGDGFGHGSLDGRAKF
jgi:hypothetical protein